MTKTLDYAAYWIIVGTLRVAGNLWVVIRQGGGRADPLTSLD